MSTAGFWLHIVGHWIADWFLPFMARESLKPGSSLGIQHGGGRSHAALPITNLRGERKKKRRWGETENSKINDFKIESRVLFLSFKVTLIYTSPQANLGKSQDERARP